MHKCDQCGETFDSSKSLGMHRRWNHTNPWEDKEKLERLYVAGGLSTTEIADKWNCGSSTIADWLDKHGIEKRDRGGKANDAPWKDPDTLEGLYWEQGLSRDEIAERLDCTVGDVRYNMEKHGVPRRDDGGVDPNVPWRDEEKVRELYVEKEMTQPEIARELDIGCGTVSRWMDIHDIDSREQPGYRAYSVPYMQVWYRHDGVKTSIGIHRLVAYAHEKMDFEELCNSRLVVHHKNEIKWDNSPENLEVMTLKEHAMHHHGHDFSG